MPNLSTQTCQIKSRRIEGGNDYIWEKQAKTRKLPVEPDALFSLRFPARTAENQVSHFCYEADRGSMPMADMRTKLQLHVEAFGVHPIRAVLIETTDEPRARKLMGLAQEPMVMGNSKRSGFLVDLSAVSNLHYQDDLVGLNRINHAVVTYPEAPGAFQAVTQGFPKLHRMRGEL